LLPDCVRRASSPRRNLGILRQHSYDQKILHLPVSELHWGIIDGILDAAIPAVVAAKTTEIRSRFDRNFVCLLTITACRKPKVY
jgi:hypothetical protein